MLVIKRKSLKANKRTTVIKYYYFCNAAYFHSNTFIFMLLFPQQLSFQVKLILQ